ncbi:TPA: transcriptional regulator [Acinetobacter baumannii]|jgi:hypothetical protein|uniref:transcriptional regulator n=1 Tax=Acinetobacter TaxID=469 RepID=UPI0002D12964|nr:transcriptional regulator [Acinetobacter baumannii]EKT7934345.1 transcriptional regulator [Acinetobacter baumannii]EKT8682748.1 transcriptional regulator [Acinetobacter baumannii]EKT9126023.1 transcriptional regulator [Acinetobacter baumannii]EKT9294270.1 transcriptional regulator [Acinetobacter baumannii]EKU3010457.1 transcriptional regulator [Acinetobacter baumannii]
MQNLKEIKRAELAKRRKDIFESLKPEDQIKLRKFQATIRVQFCNQQAAAEAFDCSQGSISRYLSGEVPVPYNVARRLEELTNGAIKVDQILRD